MSGTSLLEQIQARRCLEEINHFLLGGSGEIMEVPGKISLVWEDEQYDNHRYLAVKTAGSEHVLVNGRRFPATEAGLKQGLVACLSDLRSGA